jgi:hypothetical protein
MRVERNDGFSTNLDRDAYSPRLPMAAPRRCCSPTASSPKLIVELVDAGLANAEAERLFAGGRAVPVTRVRITEAKRR